MHRLHLRTLLSIAEIALILYDFLLSRAVVWISCWYLLQEFDGGLPVTNNLRPLVLAAGALQLYPTLPNAPSKRSEQIAAQFKGRTTQKKLKDITDNLERMEYFSQVIIEQRDGITYWRYIESFVAA